MTAEVWTIGLACLALLVAAYALFNRRLSRLQTRLEQTGDSLLRTSRKLEYVEDQLRRDLQKLRYELRQATNTLQFTEDMTFRQALERNPRVQEVMAEMHVGGCPDCRVNLDTTLAQGARQNAVDVLEFMVALNNLPAPAPPPANQSHHSLRVISCTIDEAAGPPGPERPGYQK